MTIIGLLVGICVILFACWLLNTYMPAPWKIPALVVVCLLALVWLLSVFMPGLANLRVGG